MDEEIARINLFKKAFIYALIIAAFNFLLVLLVYYIKPSLLVSIGYGVVNFVLGILLYVFFILQARKEVGGFWGFRDAMKTTFVMIFTAGFLHSLVSTLYFTYIEPSIYDKLAPYMMDNMAAFLEKAKVPQKMIDETIEEGLEGLRRQYKPSFKEWVSTMTGSILIYFILSTVLSFIFKKENQQVN